MMHKDILDAVIKNCRQRIVDGDCPTVPHTPIETLENAVDDLAAEVERLSTLRASGRLAPEVEGDVVEAARDAFYESEGTNENGIVAVVDAVTGIISSEVREKCAAIAEALEDEAPSGSYDNGGTMDGWQMACRKIAEIIRTGTTR